MILTTLIKTLTLPKQSLFRFCVSREALIKQKFSEITYEDGKSIADSKLISQYKIDPEGNIVIQLELNENYRKIKSLLKNSLQKIEWAKNIDIQMAPKPVVQKAYKSHNLEKINKIIAVSSCKGGVGKSTVACNLAYSLSKLGYKVGIFDADVYGPSLPTLINKEQEVLRAPENNPKSIIPIEYEGVKVMSYGFASQNKKAVIRGPMVSAIVSQLVFSTDWGELDYLVVDMPPGTGDIQITLCQELQFNGAVIVTTPQKLSFVDVVKGIEMFDDLKVPTIAVVENMSQFICEKCNHSHFPFGHGYVGRLKQQFGIQHSFQIPIFGQIAQFSDAGKPVCLVLPDEHTITKTYTSIAQSVQKELEALKDQKPPLVRYQTGTQNIIVEKEEKVVKKIKAQELRKKCQCALCVDEFTGKNLIKEGEIKDGVYPFKIEPKGNYAVAIVWSDGHKSSIYPYKLILSDQVQAMN